MKKRHTYFPLILMTLLSCKGIDQQNILGSEYRPCGNVIGWEMPIISAKYLQDHQIDSGTKSFIVRAQDSVAYETAILRNVTDNSWSVSFLQNNVLQKEIQLLSDDFGKAHKILAANESGSSIKNGGISHPVCYEIKVLGNRKFTDYSISGIDKASMPAHLSSLVRIFELR